MRLAVAALAALLLLLPVSTEAPAQGLGNVLGPVVAPVDSLLRRGARKVLRPFTYRPRIRAPRSSAVSRRAVAQPPQRDSGRDEAAQAKPFWPEAPQDIFDYVLLSEDADFWVHSRSVMVGSMFTQSPSASDRRAGARIAANDNAEQTVGAALAGSGEMVCAERDTNHAAEAEKELRRKLVLTRNQQNAFAALRSAMQRAEAEMIAACPYSVPDTVPERLRTMQDRLWAMRVALTSLRMPLQKFYDVLTNEQKATLDKQKPPPREGKKDEAENQCPVAGQIAPQWPADEIARAVRPNKDQQAGLAALNETSAKMGMLLTGSCPRKMPATPLTRLDATFDWLDALLFAGINTAVEVDDFYRNLTDEQKTKLNGLDL